MRSFLGVSDYRMIDEFTFNGLHDVVFQNIGLFITTGVRTSNHTNDF